MLAAAHLDTTDLNGCPAFVALSNFSETIWMIDSTLAKWKLALISFWVNWPFMLCKKRVPPVHVCVSSTCQLQCDKKWN
uniref:Uncharacterized protein n=1 Tax=Anguilla anguilla TaxID=7936 RepID=A0A0E9X709_ANGAN